MNLGINLASKKVSKATCSEITNYLYENRGKLSSDLLFFYADVRGLIEIQLRKSSSQRMTMAEIIERAYNIESYVLAVGASSFNQTLVTV